MQGGNVMGKPTFQDLFNATSADLRRVYKLDDRGLEKEVKRHMDGINSPAERREFFESVYNGKRKS